MMRTLTLSVAVLVLASFSSCRGSPGAEPAPPEPPPPPSEECTKLMKQLRSLRDGPQPCETQEDCVVWHNGTYWDGCPPEVNATNAKELDGLRKQVEEMKCVVEVGALCQPQAVNGCVQGQCGAAPLYKLKLTPSQRTKYDEIIMKARTPAPEGEAEAPAP